MHLPISACDRGNADTPLPLRCEPRRLRALPAAAELA
jgi:hypothetical protein